MPGKYIIKLCWQCRRVRSYTIKTCRLVSSYVIYLTFVCTCVFLWVFFGMRSQTPKASRRVKTLNQTIDRDDSAHCTPTKVLPQRTQGTPWFQRLYYNGVTTVLMDMRYADLHICIWKSQRYVFPGKVKCITTLTISPITSELLKFVSSNFLHIKERKIFLQAWSSL